MLKYTISFKKTDKLQLKWMYSGRKKINLMKYFISHPMHIELDYKFSSCGMCELTHIFHKNLHDSWRLKIYEGFIKFHGNDAIITSPLDFLLFSEVGCCNLESWGRMHQQDRWFLYVEWGIDFYIHSNR